jgi:hypothetical protein
MKITHILFVDTLNLCYVQYTEPPKCLSATCMNTNRWHLDVQASTFMDWQKVRAQEHANEIPSGCMPRTLEIILRHDAVCHLFLLASLLTFPLPSRPLTLCFGSRRRTWFATRKNYKNSS